MSTQPPFLNFLWISHSIKGRHNGESFFWQRIPTATSILNAILPIISAESALFGVYADDLFSRWRAYTKRLKGDLRFGSRLKPSETAHANVEWDNQYPPPLASSFFSQFTGYWPSLRVAGDLFSRWRTLRGFRNTLKRRPRVATVAFDGRSMG